MNNNLLQQARLELAKRELAKRQQLTPESQGAVKQADGTYRGATFFEGLKQSAIGAGNAAGREAIGLGEVFLNNLGPLGRNFGLPIPMSIDAQAQEAAQTGEELKTQMNPRNQAQKGGSLAFQVGEVALPLAKPAAWVTGGLTSDMVLTGSKAGTYIEPKILQKTQSIFKGAVKKLVGKTEQEILATAPENAYKLNKAEKAFWDANNIKNINTSTDNELAKLKANSYINNSSIEASHGITKEQIIKDLSVKNAATNKAAANLEKELSKKAQESVENLREPLRNLSKEKSDIFGKLRDNAMKGREDINVSKTTLSSTVDKTVSDPNVAAIVKDKLGITGTGKGGKTTLGEMYDRLSSLRAQANPYNPSDYANNEAIKVMNDIMKKNGVDFTDANKMWQEWAPVKTRMEKAFDIYNMSGQTTTANANNLIKAAKGVDAGSVKFINTLEGMTGKDLTSDVKTVLSKMTANERTALANKIKAEAEILESAALKADQLRSAKIQDDLAKGLIDKNRAVKLAELESRRIEDYRKAWKSRVGKWILLGGGGTIFTVAEIKRLISGTLF